VSELRTVAQRASIREVLAGARALDRSSTEVPKTSVGKFDKKVLRARYAEGGMEVTTLG
jgi:acyl-CoA synthetase (AMP-forming)/AMP-acid ligase II